MEILTKINKMTKPTTKKRKYRCKNPGCNGLTDCPSYYSGKIYCQKCTLFRKTYKHLPSKEYIEALKREGLWKS